MKKLISLSLIIIINCSLLVGCNFNDILQLISTTNNSKEELNFEPGEVLVLLDEEISEVNKVHSKEFFGGVEIESILDLTYRSDPNTVDDEEGFRQTLLIVLAEKTKEAVLDAVEIIKSIPGVLSAGPNYYLPLDSTVPNDPIFSFSHNSDDQWGLEKIEVDKVWDYSTGTPAVRIGIIDTGISNHDDLDNNYVAALDFYLYML